MYIKDYIYTICCKSTVTRSEKSKEKNNYAHIPLYVPKEFEV